MLMSLMTHDVTWLKPLDHVTLTMYLRGLHFVHFHHQILKGLGIPVKAPKIEAMSSIYTLTIKYVLHITIYSTYVTLLPSFPSGPFSPFPPRGPWKQEVNHKYRGISKWYEGKSWRRIPLLLGLHWLHVPLDDQALPRNKQHNNKQHQQHINVIQYRI